MLQGRSNMVRAAVVLILALCCGELSGLAFAQEPADAERDAEAERQRAIVERFLSVLEKNPRRGTARDRVYGFQVEWGTLEELVAKYRQRVDAKPEDGAAWMVLGLIESQRGKDAAATEAFAAAEKHLTASPIASYYLGQSLVLVGQPEQAAAAFERAIERKPGPADLLEIFQALGRVHQRAQRTEQALAVWDRLEKSFPGDLRVQEQIASTLVEENQLEQALPRYESLAANAKDPYRKSLYQIEAAELKVRLGRSAQGLADFERLLGELNPDHWLYRDVRRRIDEVFLRTDDQAGLAQYYETWIDKHPEDVDAMTRLARILSSQARTAEARRWLEKALARAPSRKDLRLALVDQLVADRRFKEAAAQYEALDKTEPNHPDYLREWGKLLLEDTTRDEAERQNEAVAIWRRLVEARPKDPLIATQVADLCRHAELSDEALALYKRAVALAPQASQYREYLGEYYHSLKRSEEALETWRGIAAGDNRNAKNLARLAEVLSGFGYLDEALPVMAEACQLEDDDFGLQVKYVELLSEAQRADEALAQLAGVDKLATNAEEAEAALALRIKLYQATDDLGRQIETLTAELTGGDRPTAERWYLLARYCEAGRQFSDATKAIDASLGLNAQSIPALATAARIHEAGGNMLAAADTNRKLAAIDRRYRTEYLTNVARLEARLGRREQALAAGRDLLVAAPGNPEHYEFYAQLCFQLGETEEGLNALRRSVRLNPSEPKVLLTLAAALAEQFRTDEATELYWQAFDKAADLEGKLGVVPRLAELYLQGNQFDRLIERLERQRREEQNSRELSICLAQAYQSASDFGAARAELEQLLTLDSRDTQLLQQLSTMAETEGDLGAAVKYQQQLAKVAPGREHESRLAQLLARSGETEAASAIWVQQAMQEQDPERLLKAIDSLFSSGREQSALAITERLLREQPRNWEILYREGAALADSKPQEADRRFEALLKLDLPDDTPSTAAKTRKKRISTASNSSASRALAARQANPLVMRGQVVYQIRRATGMDRYSSSQPLAFWGPDDYGQARMAAMAWLLYTAQKEGRGDEFLAERRRLAEAAGDDHKPMWDWYYLQLVRQDNRQIFEAAERLSKTGDPEGQWAYLSALSNRHLSPSSRSQSDAVQVPALPDDEVDHVLACYQSLKKQRPDLVQDYYLSMLLTNVTAELKRARRNEQADQIYREGLAAADDFSSVIAVMSLAAERGDVATLLELLERAEKLGSTRSGAGIAGYANSLSASLARAMSARADAKGHDEALPLLDRYLAMMARVRRQTPPRSRSSLVNPYGSNTPYYQVYLGKSSRGMQIDFPTPHEHYDHGSIQLLRNAFELYKRDDLLSDLTAHFEKQLGDRPIADQLQARLSLAYLHWWSDEKEQAAAELAKICEAIPGDIALTFEAAALRERNSEFDEALALVDSVTPLDHPTMQRRETAALRLAVRTGDIDRARQAAERLFGLRLDAQTQIQLAGLMRQLNMHELAEAVLARAGRQAGSGTSALVNLMAQYQSQNKTEIAVQIAHQILRRSPVQQRSLISSGRTVDDLARQQALTTLARSGKLKELIGRVEGQLKTSPRSLQLHQTLVEYYRAAGATNEAKATCLKMAEIQPHDSRLRYHIAQQLQQLGDAKGAIEHFSVAIKNEPRLLSQQYYNVENAYRQANKLDELLKLLEDIDIRSLGQSYYVTNMISNAMRDTRTRDLSMALFRKAWKAFPDQQAEMLGQLYDDTIWRMPEMYGYVREAVLPAAGSTPLDPWASLGNINSYSGDGRATGVLTRVLEVAAQQNKTADLAAEVQQTLQKQPQWEAGKVLLALLQVRGGQVKSGKSLLEEVLGDNPRRLPTTARWLIAQELEASAETKDLATRLYESTVDENDSGTDYSYSPLRRLVVVYEQSGRKAEARELVLKMARQNQDDSYDPEYSAYRRVQRLSTIGQQLLQLGYPIDAVRIYSELLGDEATLNTAQRFGGSSYRQSAERGLAAALKDQQPEMLAESLAELLKPKDEIKPGEPAVELTLVVQPPELNKAELTSMLCSLLATAAEQPPLKRQVDTSLAELARLHPDDLTVQVVAVIAAAAAKDEPALAATSERLEQVVERQPLEEVAAGGRPNARQRAAAAQQIGLWLAARECLKHEVLLQRGQKLATRALEAARRQAKPDQALAILRQWGQLELDRGQRQQAEARWNEMLELALADPLAAKKPAKGERPMPAARPVRAAPATATEGTAPSSCGDDSCGGEDASQVAEAAPAASGPRRPSQAPSRSSTAAVVTMEQFIRTMAIARLAAENRMHELSLRAVRRAMAGGPPLQQAPDQAQSFGVASSRIRFSSSNQDAQQTQLDQQIYTALSEVDRLWKRHAAPVDQVYEALAMAMLPEARANEVFLYPRSMSSTTVEQPQSIAALVAERAVAAQKVADLQARLEARKSQPMASLSARVALVQLAVAAGDNPRAVAALGELTERLKTETLAHSAELACHAAIPSMSYPPLSDAALPLLEVATKNLSTQASPDLGAGLLLLVARFHFDRQELEAGRKDIQEYLQASERQSARYRGDSVIYMRRQAVHRAVLELIKARAPADALDLLGQMVDLELPPSYRSRQNQQQVPLPRLAKQLAQLPAEEHYARLKAWSLPSEGRRSVRLMTSQIKNDDARPVEEGSREAVLSTATMLIEAAARAGKLADLAGELKPLAAEQVENAQTVDWLCRIALDNDAGLANELGQWVSGYTMKDAEANNRVKPLSWDDYLVTQACLNSTSLTAVGERMARRLLEHAEATQEGSLLNTLRGDLATAVATRIAGAKRLPPLEPPLARWHALGSPRGEPDNNRSTHYWTAADGHVVHLAGAVPEYVYFDYPLTGEFEFSVEAFAGRFADGNLALAGLGFEPTGRSRVFAIVSHDILSRPNNYVRNEQFNRYQLRVSPERLQVLVNHKLFYEEQPPSQTSPWLALYVNGSKQTAYRNFRLTGKPQIPRRLELVAGDRLEGWVATFYQETQPLRRAPGTVSYAYESDYGFVEVPNASAAPLTEFDWRASDGVLQGRVVDRDAGGEDRPSRLYYHRPLRSGETLSYEFFYEPEKSEVHPALDRLAFLLEPAGVQVHWMQARSAMDPKERKAPLPAEPQHRRGPAELPLMPSDWNQVSLTIAGDTAALSLNGQLIYERPLESTNDHRFGFFRWRNRTAARIRNVKLVGPWPSELSPEQLAELVIPAPGEQSETDRRLHAALMPERFFAHSAGDMLKQATSLSAEARYRYLLDWVLPPAGEASCRLYADFHGSRSRGELASPAALLASTAQETGKTDELLARIEQARGDTPYQKRGKLALSLLARIAQGQPEQAQKLLGQLTPLAAQMSDADFAEEGWPELVAVAESSRHPPLRKATANLAAKVYHIIKRKPAMSELERWLCHWYGRATLAATSDKELAWGAEPPLAWWRQVTRSTAESRGMSRPTAHWSLVDGEMTHYPGEAEDCLYFAAPLRGTFQVECELTSVGCRDFQVVYNGLHLLLPQYDRKKCDIVQFGRSIRQAAFNPPLDAKQLRYPFRLEVADGQYTAYLSDRKVYEERLPADCDPWLFLRQRDWLLGSVRNLRITGEPTIPERLELSSLSDLTGWLGDFYGEQTTAASNRNVIAPPSAWQKRGDEIYGVRLRLPDDPLPPNTSTSALPAAGIPGSKQESLLRYHRPLLEDGQVEYEFFYEPGKTMVHPAIGRMALLVEPQGVCIHPLTDAQYERSLPQGDAKVEQASPRASAAAEIPLRAGEWNRLALRLSGDELSLTVNGQEMHEHYKLAADHERFFGLFHFADETDVRVRKVVYSANWPKRLPAEMEIWSPPQESRPSDN
jgi:tetratricopeptide (TPR) repeat protein